MGVPQSRLEYTIDGNPVDLSGRGDDGGNVRAIDQDRVEIEIPPVLVNTKPWRFGSSPSPMPPGRAPTAARQTREHE